MLILGIYPVWGQFQRPWSKAFLAIFGGLGLAWAILPPLALFWLRLKRPDDHHLFYVVAALGILWQGIAYAPDGFFVTIKGPISFGYLVIFLLLALLISRYHILISFKKMAIYGLIIAALPKIIISLFSSQGLPKRYNPLTPPPYLSHLLKVQDKGIFRSYSFDSAPAPNFAAPFGLSSLGVLDPIVPKGNGHFVQQYIDRGALPLLLGGNKLRLSIDNYDPMAELNGNLRYYSLISTKFVLSQDIKFESFPLIYEDPITKVKIWGNPGAAPRLFLAPEAKVARSWEEALGRLKDTPDLTRQVWLVEGPAHASTWPPDLATGKILSFHIDPNDVRATFEAYTPGILTLTDSYSPGWRAFLNDQEVPILLVDGVFRGVRLDKPGTYKLHYSYRPPYWYLSVVLASFGCLLVLVATLMKEVRLLRTFYE